MFPWPQKLLSASQKAKLSQLPFPSVPSALEDCFGSDKLCTGRVRWTLVILAGQHCTPQVTAEDVQGLGFEWL